VTPRAGDDLPVLGADDFVVHEALPDPPPGPERDAIVALNEARARVAENALTSVLDAHLNRTIGVVLERVKGPKARRDTKWWKPSAVASSGEHPSGSVSTLEVKDLDATYIAPDRLTLKLADDIRPVMLTIATEAATDIAQRVDGTNGEADDIAVYDEAEIERAVDDAIRRILGVADRHVRELRQAVLDADSTASDLDDLLSRIEAAHRKGGNWVLMAGRTLANALANEAAYDQAMRLGCTHAQWISRRDERVRSTHVRADGQVRRMGVRFTVGRFALQHPADPALLPESWPEVAGCRCKLTFRRPNKAVRKVFELVDRFVRDGSAPSRAVEAIRLALATTVVLPGGPVDTPTPQGYGLPESAPAVTLTEPVVGYRRMPGGSEVVPGQQMVLSSQLVLGLDWKTEMTASTLAVLIPAGTAVTATGGTVILPAGTTIDVLSAGSTGVRAQVA
jgi:hypothetical protein